MAEQPFAHAGDAGAPSNPFSTGGGGPSFEFHVQTSLLATLLVRGIVPCLPPNQVTKLHLQAGHLGLRTDDVVCVADDAEGRELRLVCQIKHQIRVSASDEEFKKAVTAAWLDHRTTLADPQRRDAFALITGPAPPAVLTGLRTILEWARNTADASEFFRKLSIRKYASDASRQQIEVLRSVCAEANGAPVDDASLWGFLRRFYFLTYDFDVVGSQDLARVKTMLALAAHPPEPRAGETIWNKLFHFVTLSDPRAATLTREDLPDEVKAMCGSLNLGTFEAPVERLQIHSRAVLKRIRTSIAGMPPLPRDEPRHQLAVAVEENQFVVVSGPAGASKSALARTVFETVFTDSPLFAFQATEFARIHLDQVLLELRVGIGIKKLSALFALHRQKCLLIDGLERLLEAEPRDAFSMFLDEIRGDPSWRVVFTCRQYSVEVAEAAFFRPLGIVPALVAVPLLDDEELDAVTQALPKLKPVLADARLRRLLRNPYYLDKAALVDWNRIDPSQSFDERQLRELLWRQVVAREDVTAGGMPLKRDRAFRKIALQRARAMRSFVTFEADLDDAVQALLDDELLVRDPQSLGVAPAHDVLEDWALIREVQHQYDAAGGQPRLLFNALGFQLAMRRSYRHWLQEGLAGNSFEEPFRFASAVTCDPSLEAYWRDDTVVSLLLSERAEDYILAEKAILLGEGKSLLKRLIHLLRVACKQRHPSLAREDQTSSAVTQSWHLLPVGTGWSGVLRLIEKELPSFKLAELPWLLRFMEDARMGAANSSLPAEAIRALGLTALHFWRLTESVHLREHDLHSLAGILFSTAPACRPELTALLRQIARHRDWSHDERLFAERLLTSIDGVPACSAMPQEVAAFARRAWHLNHPPPLRRDRSAPLGRDGWYGLGEPFELRLFPPSALHGPFYFLLRADPTVGQKLVVDLVNTAYGRYTQRLRQERPGTEPLRVELRMDNSQPTLQWADSELWRAYREPGLAPDVVACALMALEKWLLDLAVGGSDLREICRELIRASNNVAVTAVVASVATAHWASVGEVILPLFRVPQFFSWDQERVVVLRVPTEAFFGALPALPGHAIYDLERKQSDQLPHRGTQLDMLMLQLQFTVLRGEIESIIDAHRSKLPAVETQTEKQRIWRLLLHRADLRRHTATPEPEKDRTVYRSIPPEPDLDRMVQDNAPATAAYRERMSLLDWAMRCFRAEDGKCDPSPWREQLSSAKTLLAELSSAADRHTFQTIEGASAYVAAVCVRDHSQDLGDEDRAWCRRVLLAAVTDQQDSRDEQVRVSRFPLHGSRPAALVLPVLLSKGEDGENATVRLVIASALTHASDEVRKHAAAGVRRFLWERDPPTVWACAGGLVRWSAIRRACAEEEQRRPWNEREDADEKASRRLPEVRAAIASVTGIEPREVLHLDLMHWCGMAVLDSVMSIVGGDPPSELAREFHRHVAGGLVQVWAQDRHGPPRDHEAEGAAAQHLAFFSLVQPAEVARDIFRPIIAAVEHHAGEVAQCLEQLIVAEDRRRRGGTFWTIWQCLTDALLAMPRGEDLLHSAHGDLTRLAATLFLRGVAWKPDAKDWQPLHGNEHRLQTLFARIGHCPPVFASYVGLLGSVGSTRLLPQGFRELSVRLATGDPRRMLAEESALANLEFVLSGWIYGRSSALKDSTVLVTALVHILGEMIEQGSSAAFHMREFIITPVGSFG